MTPTKELARSIRSRWREGQPPNALDAVQAHPDLGQDHSAVLELAYEEYCLRREAGEAIDHRAFCEQFTGCRSALRQMLSFDRIVGDNPELLAQGPTPTDWLQPGEMLGDCRVLRELGQGAFSRVYLAYEASTDRHVALKVSRLATEEARTLGPMSHDHIVPIHWARRDAAGRHLVCMPFLGGATLTDLLDRLYPRKGARSPRQGNDLLAAIASTIQSGDPPPVRPVAGPSPRGLSFVRGVARLGQSLAATLAFLHDKGRAHCDLKPSNVLLAPEGQPLLLDFNLSRGPADTGGRLGGTFPYMAPEQLGAFVSGQAMSEEQAATADVFALGVLLVELLSGEHPFGVPLGDSPHACAKAMQALQLRPPLPIRQLNPQVPASLARLIERCLCLDAKERPTAAALAEALRERPIRWARIAAAACVFVVGLGLTAWAMNLAAPSPAAPVVLPTPADINTLRERGVDEVKAARAQLARNKKKEAEEHLRAADEAFDLAIEAQIQRGADFGAWSDYFERGRVRLLLGDPAGAREYFGQAQKAYRETLHPSQAVAMFGGRGGPGILAVAATVKNVNRDGRTLAYMAYAYALNADHNKAISIAGEALTAGVGTPALLNNLGYSHLQGPKNLKEAASCFDKAIELDPLLPAARLNRAVLAFRSSAKTLPQQATKDIDEAIALVKKSDLAEPAALYLQGVLIHVKAYKQAKERCKPDHAQHLTRAAGYLERACILGLDPGPLLALDPNLEPLCKQSALDAGKLAALRKQGQTTAVWTYLVEPLGD